MSHKARRLFIGNIPWNVSSQRLKLYFEKFGKLKDAHIFFDKTTGLSKRHGFVEFYDSSFLKNVHRVDTHSMQGQNLSVQLSNNYTTPTGGSTGTGSDGQDNKTHHGNTNSWK